MDAVDRKGYTPLMLACAGGHVATVQALLGAGAAATQGAAVLVTIATRKAEEESEGRPGWAARLREVKSLLLAAAAAQDAAGASSS